MTHLIRYALHDTDEYFGYLAYNPDDERDQIVPIHCQPGRQRLSDNTNRLEPKRNRKAALFCDTVVEELVDVRSCWIDNNGLIIVRLHSDVVSPMRANRDLVSLISRELYVKPHSLSIEHRNIKLDSDLFDMMDNIHPAPNQPPR